jgi:hypothetical protein
MEAPTDKKRPTPSYFLSSVSVFSPEVMPAASPPQQDQDTQAAQQHPESIHRAASHRQNRVIDGDEEGDDDDLAQMTISLDSPNPSDEDETWDVIERFEPWEEDDFGRPLPRLPSAQRIPLPESPPVSNTPQETVEFDSEGSDTVFIDSDEANWDHGSFDYDGFLDGPLQQETYAFERDRPNLAPLIRWLRQIEEFGPYTPMTRAVYRAEAAARERLPVYLEQLEQATELAREVAREVLEVVRIETRELAHIAEQRWSELNNSMLGRMLEAISDGLAAMETGTVPRRRPGR